MASSETHETRSTASADCEPGELGLDDGRRSDRAKGTGERASGSRVEGDAAAGSAGPVTQPVPGSAESSDEEDETLDASTLADSLRALEEQARAFHTRAEASERIIRQMQTRIEALQGDQVQALLKPVIQRLAGMHALAGDAAQRTHERTDSAEQDFRYLQTAIEDALALVGLESVKAAPGAQFDARQHHASRAVPTSDASLDRRIKRVMKQGFTYVDAERVMVPAQVSVYRFDPSADVDMDELQGNHPLDPNRSKGANVE